MAGHIHTAEYSKKGWPPKRARSRAGRRKGGDGEVDGILIGRSGWEINPEGDRNGDTIDEVATGGSIQIADTWLRTTRKPAKAPADKTTAFCTRTRDEENRIDTKERTTTTNQDLVGRREEGIKGVLTVLKKEGTEFGGRRWRSRGDSEIKRSMFEVNLETGDTESRNKKGKETGRRERKRTESKAGRKDITTETHGRDTCQMLEDDGGGSSMTTNKETETTILEMLKGFVILGGETGDRKTIFKHGADKGGINLGAQEKRKTISVDTNMIEKTHDFEHTRGARRNNG